MFEKIALQTLALYWLTGVIITCIVVGILTLLVEYNKKHFVLGFIFGALLYHAIVNWFILIYMTIKLYLSFPAMLFYEYLLFSGAFSLVILLHRW